MSTLRITPHSHLSMFPTQKTHEQHPHGLARFLLGRT